MYVLISGKGAELKMELRMRHDPKHGWYCLKHRLWIVGEQDARTHCEREDGIPFEPDDFGDVYLTELTTPDKFRALGAI